MTERLESLVCVLELVRVEDHVGSRFSRWSRGRRALDRRPVARAFVAKAFYNLPTTKLLIEMLHSQPGLRRICGFERKCDIPSEATFSRAFAEFSAGSLGDRVLECAVKKYYADRPVTFNSIDATEIPAREEPVRKIKPTATDKPEPSVKGAQKPPTRLRRQLKQTAKAALAELPRKCDWGAKRNSQGKNHSWKGWKTHISWADGNVPLAVVTTSASLHDSQVAIPLIRLTLDLVQPKHILMDAAYDANPICLVIEKAQVDPLIDPNPAHGPGRELSEADAQLYKQRTTAERGNSRLKDSFGARHLRVRGYHKTHMHIMFGMLALFGDQLLKLNTS